VDNGHLPAHRTFDVPVEGGILRAAIWGERGPVVLCSHGITANHTSFQALADQIGHECRIIAPDHRGRGRSDNIRGPYGMPAHAADMMAVLDHLKLPRADVFLGHSMGGFVAVVAAARYPDRIGKVLLVDGGILLMDASWILKTPFSKWIIERLALKILGPSIQRLGMTFTSRAAYRDFWRAHPALVNDWSAYIEEYVDYDLTGSEPVLRASTSKDALMRDVESELIDVPPALKQVTCPIRFLGAERGIMNGPPLYEDRKLRRRTRHLTTFSGATIEGVNHFTIMLSERGAKAVAQEIRSLL